jgi:hypothetical protein
MCRSSIFRPVHQARKCRVANSGPLSQRIRRGVPRSSITRSSARDAAAREAGVYFKRQTLPRVGITPNTIEFLTQLLQHLAPSDLPTPDAFPHLSPDFPTETETEDATDQVKR